MNDIKFLDSYQCAKLLEVIVNLKHKLIVLLMLDCGLRVSEAISLKYEDFDFKRDLVVVKTLKKRGKVVRRKIPLSKRLYQCLAEYFSKQKNIEKDDFLFPYQFSNKYHITRDAVNKFLKTYNKKLGFKFINPHSLRHAFGTRHIAEGTPLENIKTMMGHERYDTTLIYTQIPTELLKQNISRVSDKQESKLNKILRRLGIKVVDDKKISLNFHKDIFTIGRNLEIKQLEENANKGVNTIITGGIGVGKSHLLESFQTDKKILKIDDLSGLKGTIKDLLIFLYNGDKKHVKDLIYGDIDHDKMLLKLNRTSTKNLCDEMKKIVENKEYILSIDRVDNITPGGVQFLEEVKDTFIIFCSARVVKLDKSSFMWNYDRLVLKTLDRAKSFELINKLSYDLNPEDYDLFRNHIFEQSNGNPRVIFEVIDRYRKEPIITNEVIREVRHTASLQEIDMTFVIFIGFGMMYLLRYMSKEVDNDSFRFIGGVALVLTLLSRQLLGFTKRKFL